MEQKKKLTLRVVYGPLYWKLEKLKEKKEKYEKELEHTKLRPHTYARFWHVFNPTKKVDAIDFCEANIQALMQQLRSQELVRSEMGR
jgi:hypothetical protein